MLIIKFFYIVKKNLLYLLILTVFASCKSYEKIAYLQNAGTPADMQDSIQAPIPDPVLKVGDVLIITINTNTPEAAVPFNLPLVPTTSSSQNYNFANGSSISYGLSMQNYLIEPDGSLTFPVIGKMKVAGMTKDELAMKIKSAVYPQYITEVPIVLIRYANFTISVLGEVLHPNVYPINNEKVSIFEALAMAGDMTIYGKRDNVLLIRENNGERQAIRIDLRNKDLINSNYFYLQQNDVLYVQPNNPKSRASNISTAESLSISIVGTLISLSTLIVSFLR